jgi:TonB family protein
MLAAVAAMSAIPLAAAAQQANDAPLAPIGPWNVEYADNSCLVSHNFGTGAAAIDMAFQLLPRSSSTTVAIGAVADHDSRGKAVVTLQPSGTRFNAAYGTVPMAGGRRAFIFRVWGDHLPELVKSSQIRVTAGKALDIFVAPRGMPAAFDAARTCEDDLLKVWHIDPAPLANALTPAKPRTPMETWVNNDDYPAAAIRSHESGTTVYRLTVDPTGAVTECGIVASSGSQTLDQTTCALLQKRAKYYPALDAGGKPVTDVVVDRFEWLMPLE